MNRLSPQDRCAIIRALVEGCSLRSTSRMTGKSINTVSKLLCDVGAACRDYQHRVMRNLTCKRLQVDEIWAFCYCKQRNVVQEQEGILGFGDVWTFVAIDADTKLVPAWSHGHRTALDAISFMRDVASRLANRVQLTTDGHRMYLDAIEAGFGGEIDYAMLVKNYGNAANPNAPEARYSPGEFVSASKIIVNGTPEDADISTSYIERQNLTMRMRMRRFTRLSNGFSKKLENLMHATALHFMAYNFHFRHKTLRMPPALRAGVTDHVWDIEEIVQLADAV